MSKIITNHLVDLALQATSKEEVIQALASKIQEQERLYDLEQYVQSVLERESLTSTGIGFHIAIPHGKSVAVKETTIAFGRLVKEIEWQSLDEQPVRIVFLLAVPEASKGDEHLRIIASLSRKLIHEAFRQKLISAQEDEIVALINESVAGK